MILDACFEIPKLENSILNVQMLFNLRNVELKMSQHIKRTCLWSVTGGRYGTDLDAYTSKQQEVCVHAKCYNKEITSRGCLLFTYLGLHTNYIAAFTCWFGYSQP